MNPEKEHCPWCLGTSIQDKRWVDINTDEPQDECTSGMYCNDCGDADEDHEGLWEGHFESSTRLTSHILRNMLKQIWKNHGSREACIAYGILLTIGWGLTFNPKPPSEVDE